MQYLLHTSLIEFNNRVRVESLLLCLGLLVLDAHFRAGVESGENEVKIEFHFMAVREVFKSVENGDTEALRALLRRPEVEYVNNTGVTALMISAKLGKIECIKILKPTLLKARSSTNLTAAFLAVAMNNFNALVEL